VPESVAFTVSDAVFSHLVTSDRSYRGEDRPAVDPFLRDPVLQRLVVMTQLVIGPKIILVHLIAKTQSYDFEYATSSLSM
jgi:hypothetical protein